MSTKIGIITEGPIDRALLPPLLSAVAAARAEYRWPVSAEDVVDHLPVRKRGHGGVLDATRRLVTALEGAGRAPPFDHAGFVILLDRRTRAVQEEVRQLIRPHDRFVLAVAVEEVEAWWLGDRRNTLAWAGLSEPLPATLRYASRGYRAERDDEPKRTLSELTETSDRFDRVYGEGNVDHAREFADEYWAPSCVNLDDIRGQCPQGYGGFEDDIANLFRRIRAAG